MGEDLKPISCEEMVLMLKGKPVLFVNNATLLFEDL